MANIIGFDGVRFGAGAEFEIAYNSGAGALIILKAGVPVAAIDADGAVVALNEILAGSGSNEITNAAGLIDGSVIQDDTIGPDQIDPTATFELKRLDIDMIVLNREDLTIVGGAVTVTKSFVLLAPESGTDDDLVTINGGVKEGQLLRVRTSGSNNITLKHNTGNLRLTGGADLVLNGSAEGAELIYQGAVWAQRSRY